MSIYICILLYCSLPKQIYNYVRSKLICTRRLVIHSLSHLLPTSVELDLTIVLVSDSTVSHVITGMTHIYVPAHIPTLPLQVECRPSPRAIAKCFAFIFGRALVRMSAVISSVGQ